MSTKGGKHIIVFVCTGNTCRSPMAERYFNAAVCRNENVCAVSAGLYADENMIMSYGSQRALANAGVDAGNFRSRNLTAAMCAGADMIIGMGAAHCREIIRRFPEYASKVTALLDFTVGGDVADPFGGDETAYRRCLEQMIPALEVIAEKLHNI